MDKKFLLLIGLAFVLIFAVGFLIMPSLLNGNRNNEEVINNEAPFHSSPSPAGNSGADEVVSGSFTVKKDVDGWQIVNIDKEPVFIKIPGDWQINANTDNYLFKAVFNSEKLQTAVVVNVYDNPEGFSPDKWAKQYRNVTSYKQIINNSLNGISYISKISVGEDDSGKDVLIAESYRLSEIFSRNNRIITFSCSADGIDYKLSIPICEKIADGLILK